MKKELIAIGIVFTIVVSLDILTDNRERLMSTNHQEEEARIGIQDEAKKTLQEEEAERLGYIHDSAWTSAQERQGKYGHVEYSSSTQAAERAARS